MKRILGIALTVFSLNTFAATPAPPHFDLEMTGAEWRYQMEKRYSPFSSIGGTSSMDPIIAFGKRNLDWLKFINSTRTKKISFTDPSTMNGIPIEAPKEYSDVTTLKAFNDLIPQLPPSMKKVLVDNDPLTADPGVSDAEYIKWGHKIDVVYQTAARWITMEPWLTWMIGQRQKDVRGHYFLSRESHLDANLRDWSNLPTGVQGQYRQWMIANCMNARYDEAKCAAQLAAAEASQNVKGFYDSYKTIAKDNWDSFFKIPVGIRFSSLVWERTNPDLATIPFADPGDQDFRDYLWKNIEDEWKWLTWQLKLDFHSTASNQVNVHWEPGITPHVAGLGSSEVYMDSNAPLTEWDVQWTIRHEFGHVVGMPDCYLEFYDQTRHLIVSYQHDVTDLMCSRKGRFKENHFVEMKRVYFN